MARQLHRGQAQLEYKRKPHPSNKLPSPTMIQFQNEKKK